MARPRNPVERREVRVTLPLDLVTRFELAQTSPTDGGRPQGIWQDFFTRALREHFEQATLDVSGWLGAAPGKYLVRGSADALTQLKYILSRIKEQT